MAINKFTPTSPDPNIQQDSDMVTAKFGHLNTLVDEINNSVLTAESLQPLMTAGPVFQSTSGKFWSDATIWGDVAYTWSAQDGKGFIYDLSNYDNIIQAYEFPSTFQLTNEAIIEGRYLYVRGNPNSGNNKLYIYDILNPYNPILVSETVITGGVDYQTTPLQKIGNYILMQGQSAVGIFNISDIENPIFSILIASLPTGSDYNASVLLDDYYVFINSVSASPGGNVNLVLYKIDWLTMSASLIDSITDFDIKPQGIRHLGYNKFVVLGLKNDLSKYVVKTYKIVNDVVTPISGYYNLQYGTINDSMRIIGKFMLVAYQSVAKVQLFDVSDLQNIILKQTLNTAFNQMRHINTDMNKAFVASRAYPGKVQVIYLNTLKTGVVETGEIRTQDIYVDDIYSNGITTSGIYSANLGTENAKVVNLNASKKFLYPKYTTAQRTALTAEAGEAVYDTDTNKLYIYDGTTWQAAW